MADNREIGAVGTCLLGAYLVVLTLLLAYGVFHIWPNLSPPAADAETPQVLGLDVGLSLLIAVGCAGAFGSLVHAINSFTAYVGNQQLTMEWLAWYLLRPIVGCLESPNHTYV